MFFKCETENQEEKRSVYRSGSRDANLRLVHRDLSILKPFVELPGITLFFLGLKP